MYNSRSQYNISKTIHTNDVLQP